MQAANRVQQAIRKSSTSFGGWQMLAGTNLSRTISRTGVDWVCIDTEHGNIDDAQMHDAVQAVAATGVSPLVRIAANEAWMVKRALDCGAHGIMVPLMRTQLDAENLVQAAKFPPNGIRGFGSPFSMSTFASASGSIPSSIDYLKQANDALITIVQVETREALENVDAIAATDGIDVLFVGPFDLGNAIGHPYIGEMDEELKGAVEKIRLAAERAGKISGMYCTTGKQARQFADQGFGMIVVAGDVFALQNYFSDQVQAAKGSLAHAAYKGVASAASKVTGPYGK